MFFASRHDYTQLKTNFRFSPMEVKSFQLALLFV